MILNVSDRLTYHVSRNGLGLVVTDNIELYRLLKINKHQA